MSVYKESNKGSQERHEPTLGVLFKVVCVEIESTVNILIDSQIGVQSSSPSLTSLGGHRLPMTRFVEKNDNTWKNTTT